MAWPDPLPGGDWRGGYRDSAGKKQYVKDSAGKTVRYKRKSDARKAAQEQEGRARRKAATPEVAVSASITWGQWWSSYREGRSPLSDTGQSEDSIVEKYLWPRWGEVSLNQITNQAVKAWAAKLVPGLSDSYRRRIYGTFRASMNAAVTADPPILTASPCVGVKIPKVKKKPKPYMDDGHIASLGDKLDGRYRDMADFEVETGLRPGELCGLHANRLDLESGWMVVVDVFVARRKVIRPWPKDGDTRQVPLTPKAVEIAKRNLEGRDLKAGCGVPHTDGKPCRSVLLFLSPRTRRPVNPRNYAERLRRAAEKAQVPNRSPYAARRGFATWAAHGVDAFELADLMGHADVEETRGYVQMTPAARGRLLSARGVPQPLTVVRGAGAGADDGANLDKEGQDGVGREPDEKSS